jgi:hypothetical protein
MLKVGDKVRVIRDTIGKGVSGRFLGKTGVVTQLREEEFNKLGTLPVTVRFEDEDCYFQLSELTKVS